MLVCAVMCGLVKADTPLFRGDFSQTADGETPKDMAPLNGTFAVKSFEGRKVLEVPGDPVDGSGLLFGPDGQSDVAVQCRVYATTTGKRMPEFGVGIGDTTGYRLWLMPATQQLQFIKGDDVIARLPYVLWKSGTWTVLKMQMRVVGRKILLEGKAWPTDQAEPREWMIHFEESGEALKGRASLWANTYSSTPIRFEDLVESKATP